MIKLIRDTETDKETFGRIFIDNQLYCETLEDAFHKIKIPGHTRIPPGCYDITLRTEGALHEKYKTRFWWMHKGMLWLRNVPNFEWILIHPGNTHEDTAGCILPGIERGEGRVTESVKAYEVIYPIITHKILTSEDLPYQSTKILVGNPTEVSDYERVLFRGMIK